MTAFTLPPPVVIVAPANERASKSAPRAFTRQTPEGTWDTFPRAIVVSLPFGPFLEADALAETRVAARAWSELRCTALRLVVESAPAAAVTSGDGVSHVFFHTSEWPSMLVPRALAQTVVVVDGQRRLTDADIHVNGKDHVYALDGRPGTVDLRSILTHELGHLLGLGHSADADATMAAVASGTRFRSLERDDELGACTLYPGKGAARCPEVPCPVGFVCFAGTCERPGTPKTTCAPCVREGGACENAGANGRCVDVAGGRVCARPCDADHPCGAGFSCEKTSEAGDEQCVANDGCRALGVPCANEAGCSVSGASGASGGSVCREGRCVGPGEPTPRDAGGSRDADAAPDATGNVAPGDGEGCASAPMPRARDASALVFLGGVLVLGQRRRVRRG